MRRYKPYPVYKDSGIAELRQVPQHWEVKRLRFVATAANSSIDKKLYEDQTKILLCNYTDVYHNEKITNTLDFMSSTAKNSEIERFLLVEGDVIITKDSESADDIGIPAYVPHTLPGVVCGYHLTMLKSYNVESEFLFRFLQSRLAKEYFYVEVNGVTRYGLGQDVIKNLVIVIPARQEQQIIVAHLNHQTYRIDALIKKKTRLIEVLREKRQSLITHAVTKGLDPNVKMKTSGIEWIGQVPDHWNVCLLQHIVVRIEQGWSPQCMNSPAEEGQWGIVKSGCVNGGIFNYRENKALPNELVPQIQYEINVGDVLMSRASGSPELIGSVAVVSSTQEKLMLSDKIFRMHCSDKVTSSFFVHLLRSSALRTQIEQAISGAEGLANNLPQSRIKKFWVVCPPVSEQKLITEFLDIETIRIDTLISKIERSIELLKERRTALITAAVTGQIDLREAKP